MSSHRCPVDADRAGYGGCSCAGPRVGMVLSAADRDSWTESDRRLPCRCQGRPPGRPSMAGPPIGLPPPGARPPPMAASPPCTSGRRGGPAATSGTPTSATLAAHSGGAHTRTSEPRARNRTASPNSGSTPPRESYVNNNTRISRLPFPLPRDYPRRVPGAIRSCPFSSKGTNDSWVRTSVSCNTRDEHRCRKPVHSLRRVGAREVCGELCGGRAMDLIGFDQRAGG
jgi:hypothetical protein